MPFYMWDYCATSTKRGHEILQPSYEINKRALEILITRCYNKSVNKNLNFPFLFIFLSLFSKGTRCRLVSGTGFLSY